MNKINRTKTKTSFLKYFYLFDYFKISDVSKKIINYIASFNLQNKECFISNTELGLLCDKKTSSISREILSLDKMGLINRSFTNESARHRKSISITDETVKLITGFFIIEDFIKELNEKTGIRFSFEINRFETMDIFEEEFFTKMGWILKDIGIDINKFQTEYYTKILKREMDPKKQNIKFYKITHGEKEIIKNEIIIKLKK